jgi:ankyrin repeat protein
MPSTKTELNKQLLEAAKTGDAEEAASLLEQGANVDGNNGEALIWAAYAGHLEVVKVLLDAGADTTLINKDMTAEEWALGQGHTEIARALKGPRKKTSTPNQIIYDRRVSDRMLEEIFDFETLEKISLIRKDGRNGPVEAVEIKSFAEIETQPRLREAFNEHVRRGGKIDESLVFPHALPGKNLRFKS